MRLRSWSVILCQRKLAILHIIQNCRKQIFSTATAYTNFYTTVAMRYFTLCELCAVVFSFYRSDFDLIFNLHRVTYCLPSEFLSFLPQYLTMSLMHMNFYRKYFCTLPFGIHTHTHTQYILLNHSLRFICLPTAIYNFDSLSSWLALNSLFYYFYRGNYKQLYYAFCNSA